MEMDPMGHRIRAAPQPMGNVVEHLSSVLVYSYPGAHYKPDTCGFGWVVFMVVWLGVWWCIPAFLPGHTMIWEMLVRPQPMTMNKKSSS